MSVTWHSSAPPPRMVRAPGHWRRVVWRAARIAPVIGAGVLATLLLRLAERPLHGATRPWTPAITVWVCRRVLAILELTHAVMGTPMRAPGGMVANHVSWIDIFALNAAGPVNFVAKSEVAGWPGIGFLARLTGTAFVTRAARAAREQTALLRDRLAAGQRLMVFPEGTSTDGMRLRPFKSTLFGALCAFGEARQEAQVQPVTLVYEAPDGEDPRFYGWWGDMELGDHLLMVLGAARQGRVRVILHPPITLRGCGCRKALAAACEAAVRAGLPPERRGI